MFNFNINFFNSSNLQTNNGLFLFISKMCNKLPYAVKFAIKIILVILLTIKLFGITITEFLNTPYYLKIYFIVSGGMAITYYLLTLYFLHRAINNKLQVSKVLPDFIQEWLKEQEEASKDTWTINDTKKNSYVHVCIYLVFIILALLVL